MLYTYAKRHLYAKKRVIRKRVVALFIGKEINIQKDLECHTLMQRDMFM